MKRSLRTILIVLGAGLISNIAITLVIIATVDLRSAPEAATSSYLNDVQWTLTRANAFGAVRLQSDRVRGTSWSVQQVVGPPNAVAGDNAAAWASATADGGPEWLIVEYANPVVAREVHVYENCAPGALYKISIFNSADQEIEIWHGDDPSPPSTQGVAVSKIPVSLDTPTRKIKLYLACDKVPGWNEVDAVGLVDNKGNLQWARSAQCSSSFASRYSSYSSGDPSAEAPSWSGLNHPLAAFANYLTNHEERVVDGRGWPLIVLASEMESGVSSSGDAPASQNSNLYDGEIAMKVGSGFGRVSAPGRPAGGVYYRVVWTGVLFNSVILGLGCFLIWIVLVVPRRFVREVARFRNGACIQCGYDLGYDFIKGCPECGWRRERR